MNLGHIFNSSLGKSLSWLVGHAGSCAFKNRTTKADYKGWLHVSRLYVLLHLCTARKHCWLAMHIIGGCLLASQCMLNVVQPKMCEGGTVCVLVKSLRRQGDTLTHSGAGHTLEQATVHNKIHNKILSFHYCESLTTCVWCAGELDHYCVRRLL